MQLEFKKIEIHSFMSFEDESFEFDAHKGITLIRGVNHDIPEETNGSGKTNLWNSLIYVLFGQIPGEDTISNKNVVNKYSQDKDMRISLSFSADGVPYRIVRGMSNGKQSYLELYRYEEDVTKSTIAETQEYVEKELVMCDMSMFLRTVMLTASHDYSFYRMKKADKKEFVEKLFDISVFGDMYQAMHRDVLDFDKDIMSRQNRLVVLNRTADDYVARISQYDEKKEARLKEIDESITKAEKEYEIQKSRKIAKNTEEMSKLDAAKDKILRAKADINKELTDRTSKNSKIDVTLHKLRTSKESKQSAIDKHSEIMGKLCDDCRSVFNEYYKISQSEKEIADIDAKSAGLKNDMAANSVRISELNAKSSELTDKQLKVENKTRQLNETFNKETRQLALMESKMSSLVADRTRIEKETNPYVELHSENKRKIDDETSALDKIEKRYRYLKFAEGVVSQETLRKFIISDLIGLLNNKIRTYLTKMGSRYTVEFDSDMNYTFVTAGGEYQFGQFSNGEKTRIMIATSFAFRDFMSIRNGLNTNILVCDEFFDSAISSACLKHIVDILRGYADECGQNIYVITQRQEIEPTMIDGIVQVEKRNNISRIVYPG